jgi:Fur family ferric uptake transcriptional regulator
MRMSFNRLAREREPRISLATVYRNLKLFKDLGLVAESTLGETHSHYELKGKTGHHHWSASAAVRLSSSIAR